MINKRYKTSVIYWERRIKNAKYPKLKINMLKQIPNHNITVMNRHDKQKLERAYKKTEELCEEWYAYKRCECWDDSL